MIALCVVALLFSVVSCDLTIAKTKECGQITCEYLYYCSNIENACKPCRKVCDAGGNQDMKLCNRHCQGKSNILPGWTGFLSMADFLLFPRAYLIIAHSQQLKCFICDANFKIKQLPIVRQVFRP